jgi:predicted nucleotidyltransferase
MKTRKDYINILKANSSQLRTEFGIRSLRLFGSVSREEQREGSDVDICVEMEPKIILVSRLKRYLENILECSVDIVRMHKHITPFLKKEIEKDGIYVIQ